MTPRIHSCFIRSLEKVSFEAASCHDLTTIGLNSRCHVPRQVTEALSLPIRYMNAHACPFPPFQSTNVCSLGIFRTLKNPGSAYQSLNLLALFPIILQELRCEGQRLQMRPAPRRLTVSKEFFGIDHEGDSKVL